MDLYPKMMLELEEQFSTEEACRDYLFQLRWPNGFVCPRCDHNEAWSTDRNLYHCSSCNLQTSVTAGTIFHRSKKPLRLWFRAIWHITSQKYGANALGLQRVMGFGSYNTAWDWLHKLRQAMVRPDRDKLSGVLVVDETYVGGRKTGKRGRGAEGKSLVMVAVEDKGMANKKGIGRIRLSRVKDASATSLISFIKKNVESGSTVRTDGWHSYSELPSSGYTHIVERDNYNVGDDPIYICHLVISLFKRWLLGTYQGAVSPKHLDYYLDEYTFRFNRRTSRSRGKLFYRLTQQAVIIGPVPRKQMLSKKERESTA
jgi:transposase-like protein